MERKSGEIIQNYILQKLIRRNSMDSVNGRLGEFNGSCEGNITSKR